MPSETPFFNKLTLRMIVPVVMVVCAVGIGFYFFVLRTLSEYAEQQIQASLARNAKEIYDICDRNFTTLLQGGQLDNAKMVRIRQALTLGMIEDYAKRNNLQLLLLERGRQAILTFQPDSLLADAIERLHRKEPVSNLRVHGKMYYFHHLDFKPWSWHIELMSDTRPFESLIDRVKLVYALTAVVLLLGLSAMILALDGLLRSPVQRIITAIRDKRPPDYRGIHEFEFLSQNIAGLMTSLEERTQWIERLYSIGTTHRGETFFNAIARVMADEAGLNTIITKAAGGNADFHVVAVAQVAGDRFRPDDLAGNLPCKLLVGQSEPTIVSHGAAEHFAAFKGIAASKAECYVGLTIPDREGRTIGCAHLFGDAREMDSWDMNFIKTAGRMVGSEFELMQREQEQEQIREQMFRSQKLESLGLLAGGVAHDFNNLLMGIQGRVSLILDDGRAPRAVTEHIEAIEDYVRGASDLADQLLGFARGGKYDVKPADINAVLEQSARMFGRTKKEIVIHTDFAADLHTVEIDRRQIEQVFLNLFVNAWHAMPSGGDLMLKTENVLLDETYIGLHGNSSGQFVKIAIADTGTGMDAETLSKIFDPFFTTREMGRGTGLGLAMVYGIIKNHDGLITARSKVGRGSVFTVYLPASDKVYRPEIRTEKQMVPGTETILLVDDEEMIVEVAQAMLERLGYRVVAVDGGQGALDVLARSDVTIDLVLLDLVMPGMNGGTVFDRLREMRPQMPVIISSGYAIDGEAEAIMRRGCNGFIQKPYSMSELSRKVREILDG